MTFGKVLPGTWDDKSSTTTRHDFLKKPDRVPYGRKKSEKSTTGYNKEPGVPFLKSDTGFLIIPGSTFFQILSATWNPV